MPKPEVVIQNDKDCIVLFSPCMQSDTALYGATVGLPHDSMKTGSVSLTIGKWRRFLAYTAWLPMLSNERRLGK